MVNRKGPILLRDDAWLHAAQSALPKLNKLGYKALPLLPSSPDLSPTEYQSFKHLNNFLQGKRLHNQQEAENAFQEFTKSQRTDFYATGISKPIVVGKNIFIVMVPSLINKDVFKLSYDDLISMDQNHNCFRTNLNISVVKSTS